MKPKPSYVDRHAGAPALFIASVLFAIPIGLTAIFYTWYGGAMLARYLGASDPPAALCGIFTVMFAVALILLIVGLVLRANDPSRVYPQGERRLLGPPTPLDPFLDDEAKENRKVG